MHRSGVQRWVTAGAGVNDDKTWIGIYLNRAMVGSTASSDSRSLGHPPTSPCISRRGTPALQVVPRLNASNSCVRRGEGGGVDGVVVHGSPAEARHRTVALSYSGSNALWLCSRSGSCRRPPLAWPCLACPNRLHLATRPVAEAADHADARAPSAGSSCSSADGEKRGSVQATDDAGIRRQGLTADG